MTARIVIGIVGLAVSVISLGLYRYFSENVKLKYKEQRVGGARYGR